MIDVQKLAREAGLANQYWPPSIAEPFERFAALVLEEAAKVCDEEHKRAKFNMNVDVAKNHEFWNGAAIFADQIGEDIRSLKPGNDHSLAATSEAAGL